MTLLLLAGCAAGPGPAASAAPAPEKRYALEFPDAMEALQRGEGRQALAYYEWEAEVQERRGQRLEAAKAHSAVTFVAQRLGLYQRGIRSGLRALELLGLEPQADEVLRRTASVRNAVGFSYLQAGDLQEAERHFREGLESARAFTQAGPRRFFSAVCLRGLASVAWARRDYARAIQQGKEAASLLEDQLARLPPARFAGARADANRHLAYALTQVGGAQQVQGDLAGAEDSLRRALAAARSTNLDEVEAGALRGLGWLALSRKDYAAAVTYFQDALGTRAQYPGLLIFAHQGIGRAFAAQGRHDEALAAFQRAMALVDEVRGELQETSLRSGFLEDKQAIYQDAVGLALTMGRPAEAFGYAERARARAFLDLLGNQTTLSKGRTRALVREEVQLRAQLAEAQALAQDAGGAEGGDELSSARQQVEASDRAYRAFLDRVRKENLEQASLMTVEQVTLAEVQALLPDGVTLLEYQVTGPQTILWVVDRQRVEVVRIPIARRALVSEVRAFRQGIEHQAPLAEVQDRARALYGRLLAPARPHVHGALLLIVPHDVLHYLPFAALRTPDDHWLIEDYTLATLPSASVLRYLKNKGAAAGAPTFAIGNPDLGPALALRYAEREAHAVGAHYPGATVLVRRDATEAKAKALIGRAGLLHFATHGELDEKDPLSSALLLVPEGQEDGRLEVREIFGLDMHARLVVLSACETGLGQLSRGDELVGLQRAFLYAGTPAVVTTLWKVDDRASFRLMEAFYDVLQTHSPAAALRQAQRATMAEFPHPFAWAAFGLTGAPW
jgi:CHAT domain-containing protein/Tfp pilus assembly protein PilF